jgi:thiamine-phosphate pyrophosphorylase
MLDRRARLERSRLYLVCGARPGGRDPEPFLRAALAGGVDLVQLREKDATDERVLAAAEAFARACREAGALFLVNDRPDLAVAAGADGVHVGQDDVDVARAREVVGPDRLVGVSTHSPEQLDSLDPQADYAAVGPVHATPTKPGRPAVGLEPVRYAAAHARLPWFAIGGIDASNLGAVVAAGARRVVVVRAIAEADDPEAAARTLRAALGGEREEARIGTA